MYNNIHSLILVVISSSAMSTVAICYEHCQ